LFSLFPHLHSTFPSSQLENHLAEIINNWGPWQKVPGHLQAFFFGLMAMITLPHVPDLKNPIKTYASEALHFRRGIREFVFLEVRFERAYSIIPFGQRT
jgi:hypothetical protein